MFVLKNAWETICRHKARSVTMAIVAFLVSALVVMSVAVVNVRDTANANYESQQVNAVIAIDRAKVMKDKGVTDPSKVDWTSYNMVISDYQKYLTAMEKKGLTAVNMYYDEAVPVNLKDKKPAGADKGSVKLVGFSNESAANDAPNGPFTIKDGQALTYDGSVMGAVLVSQAFADANSLKVGDKFTITSVADKDTTYDVTVGGIYENTNAPKAATDETKDNPDNAIYTDLYSFMLSGASNVMSSTVDKKAADAYTMNVVWQLSNPSDYEKFAATVRDAGLGDDYTIYSPTVEDHEFAMAPLNRLADALRIAWIALAVAGAAVVLVCAVLTVRRRDDEIGMMVAMGVGKGRVAWQAALETLIITVVTLALGTAVGAFASAPASTAAVTAVASTMPAQPDGANGDTSWFDTATGAREYGHTTDGVQDGRITNIGAQPSGQVLGSVSAAAAGLAIIAAAIGIVRVSAFNPRSILLPRDVPAAGGSGDGDGASDSASDSDDGVSPEDASASAVDAADDAQDDAADSGRGDSDAHGSDAHGSDDGADESHTRTGKGGADDDAAADAATEVDADADASKESADSDDDAANDDHDKDGTNKEARA